MISAAFPATDCGGTGWLFLFNATLLICAEGSVPEEEIRTFAEMHLPFRIECPGRTAPGSGTDPELSKAAPCNIPADALCTIAGVLPG